MGVVDSSKVKELRERTQAGFGDCKKALEESNNDIEKAIIWLREKGISKAAKKAGAIAAEGKTVVLTDKDLCAIVEVNSQTDFASKSKLFLDFVDEVANAILKNKTAKDFANIVLKNKKTIDQSAMELTGQIGEKIVVRRAEVLQKTADQSFGIYQHFNSRISVAILIDGKVSAEAGKDVAMQIASMRPKFISEAFVDPEWKKTEWDLIVKKTIDEGKPQQFAEKIAEGRFKKLLAEYCLNDQEFIKDSSLTVGKYLEKNGGKVLKMVRYEVGEGIEKVQSDFAAEVSAQMKK
ncbi:MAG: elongation factor Ts [Malacoplasma sp.]|nr:elongation factor Ts [Malacoplasma sp.]